MNIYYIKILGFLLLSSACTPKKNSAQKQCEQQNGYVWFKEQCMDKNSTTYQRYICLSGDTESRWINNTCVGVAEYRSLKETCERNPSSKWVYDETNKTGSCASQTRVVTNEEACKEQAGYAWDKNTQTCLSPEAQICTREAKVWYQGACYDEKDYLQVLECNSKTDGSRFINGQCRSVGEQNCLSSGYKFYWKKSENEAGSCLIKGFVQYCEQISIEEIPVSLQSKINHTVEQIKNSVNKSSASCIEVHQELQQKTRLTINGAKIESILPMIGLDQITSLDLKHNDINDLDGLEQFKKVKELDLSHNNLTNILRLEQLKSLESVNLGHNQLVSLAALSDLEQLKYLNAQNNLLDNNLQLINIDAILENRLGKLENLILDGNCSLNKIGGLNLLSSLKELSIQQTGFPEKPNLGISIEHSKCP